MMMWCTVHHINVHQVAIQLMKSFINENKLSAEFLSQNFTQKSCEDAQENDSRKHAIKINSCWRGRIYDDETMKESRDIGKSENMKRAKLFKRNINRLKC